MSLLVGLEDKGTTGLDQPQTWVTPFQLLCCKGFLFQKRGPYLQINKFAPPNLGGPLC